MKPAKLLVEFLGVFFLVLTIGMTVIDPGGAGAMAPLAIASVLMVMVYAGGHVSGAHYNPAVTIAVFLRGKCPASDVVPYIIAQCAAAAAAGALVLFLKQGETITPMVLTTVPALLAEFLFTFALAFVVLNVATTKSTAGNSYYGLAIGFTVLAGAYAVGGVSGGAFNPAVGAGPLLLRSLIGESGIQNLWLYVAGPLLGGIVAALVFRRQEVAA